MIVGIDARPALLHGSGIARASAELVRALGAFRDEVGLVLYGDSWRRLRGADQARALVDASGGRLVRARIPGRVQRLLGAAGLGVEWRTGPLDLFHYTDIVYPRVARTPTVVTLHDVVFEVMPRFHDAAFLRYVPCRVRRAVAQAAAVIVSSEETRRQVIERHGVDAAAVHCVPLGADHLTAIEESPAAEVDALLARHGIDGPILLCVATIEPRKNHAALLDAFAAFSVHRPHHLLLIGDYGWMCDAVRERLQRGERQVHHLAHITDRLLVALYRRAELTVYPSLYEGFGLPVLESMALGAPVLTTRCGAIPEVAGDAALYCESTDAEAIAAALARLADDATLRASLAQRGLARAAAFTWRATARRHVDIYRALVSRR